MKELAVSRTAMSKAGNPELLTSLTALTAPLGTTQSRTLLARLAPRVRAISPATWRTRLRSGWRRRAGNVRVAASGDAAFSTGAATLAEPLLRVLFDPASAGVLMPAMAATAMATTSWVRNFIWRDLRVDRRWPVHRPCRLPRRATRPCLREKQRLDPCNL